MKLLQRLEYELKNAGKELHRLTRERTVLMEQITRLRTGVAPEIVNAALRAALGERSELYLHNLGTDTDQDAALRRIGVNGSRL